MDSKIVSIKSGDTFLRVPNAKVSGAGTAALSPASELTDGLEGKGISYAG